MGCHIDGYIATVAHTVVVGETDVTGPKADVMTAAYTGLQVAWKSCRAGAKVRGMGLAYGSEPKSGGIVKRAREGARGSESGANL